MNVNVILDSTVTVIHVIQKERQKERQKQLKKRHQAHQLSAKTDSTLMKPIEHVLILMSVLNIRIFAIRMPIALIDWAVSIVGVEVDFIEVDRDVIHRKQSKQLKIRWQVHHQHQAFPV